MSGVALKITTLVIRTASKPIANRIKAQAREHEGFRRICVGWAQLIHRVDMRLRLGLLQDPAALERQAAREAADAAKRKAQAAAPTVKTEAQTRADEAAAREAVKEGVKKAKKENVERRIKPLSEAKAIDLGSNFIAESFLFAVAVGTVLFETYRSRRKEGARRNDVAERLEELEQAEERSLRRIEELEGEVRGLRERGGWHWPWQQQGHAQGQLGREGGHALQAPGGEEVGESRVLAQVAEAERERGDKSGRSSLGTQADGDKSSAVRTSSADTKATQGSKKAEAQHQTTPNSPQSPPSQPSSQSPETSESKATSKATTAGNASRR